jgi:hypothetical protein
MGKDTVDEGAPLKNTGYLLKNPTADNLETDLDDEALEWAGPTGGKGFSTRRRVPRLHDHATKV